MDSVLERLKLTSQAFEFFEGLRLNAWLRLMDYLQ
jgi:hypothetical protein